MREAKENLKKETKRESKSTELKSQRVKVINIYIYINFLSVSLIFNRFVRQK